MLELLLLGGAGGGCEGRCDEALEPLLGVPLGLVYVFSRLSPGA